MIVIKDAMILIHLAKTSVLEDSCDLFEMKLIPNEVWEETVKIGKEKGYPDAKLIEEIIDKNKIEVCKVDDNKLIERANDFNIQGGEAEAVALYWEKEADFLATDDDNVRRKRVILELDIIGTLSIIIKLFEEKKIDKDKVKVALDILGEVGWFSTAVLDKTKMEVGLI